MLRFTLGEEFCQEKRLPCIGLQTPPAILYHTLSSVLGRNAGNCWVFMVKKMVKKNPFLFRRGMDVLVSAAALKPKTPTGGTTPALAEGRRCGGLRAGKQRAAELGLGRSKLSPHEM